MTHIIQVQSYHSPIDGSNLLIQGERIQAQYETYLADESRLAGSADAIAFPKDEGELSAILASCHTSGIRVTLSGARTGITGGAVPDGGALIALEKMNQILPKPRLLLEVRWPAMPPGPVRSIMGRPATMSSHFESFWQMAVS